MRPVWLAAGAVAALAIGTPATAQYVAPGYHLQQEYFRSGPPATPGQNDIEAPGQDVPSIAGQTHVPSLSAQGRGRAPWRTEGILAPQP